MPRVHVCTIVSRSSLARARVMADTLREHHAQALVDRAAVGCRSRRAGRPPTRAGPDSRAAGWRARRADGGGQPPRGAGDRAGRTVGARGDGVWRRFGHLHRRRSTCAWRSGTRSRSRQLIESLLVARPSQCRRGRQFTRRRRRAPFSYRVLALRSGAASAALLEAWPRYLAGDREDGTARRPRGWTAFRRARRMWGSCALRASSSTCPRSRRR